MPQPDRKPDPSRVPIGGTQGFIIGALAAAIIIVLTMAILNRGIFSEPQPEPAAQPGVAVPEGDGAAGG